MTIHKHWSDKAVIAQPTPTPAAQNRLWRIVFSNGTAVIFGDHDEASAVSVATNLEAFKGAAMKFVREEPVNTALVHLEHTAPAQRLD